MAFMSENLIYLLLTPSETAHIITACNKLDDRIEQLQNIVGGPIETFDISSISLHVKPPICEGYNWWVVADEQGPHKEKKRNPFSLKQDLYGDIVIVQYINGMICGFQQEDLELLPKSITKNIKK